MLYFSMPIDRSLYIDSLSFSKNGRAILSGVYLEVPDRTIVGILGRNGSGKSTLMDCIFGTLKPDFAYMRCNNKKFNRTNNVEITYLPQAGFVPRQLTIKECIKLFGLQKSPIVDIPIIREDIHFKFSVLSSGQIRFIESLLILYSRASYSLFDEPFAGLSPHYMEMLTEHFKYMKSSKGMLISDHYYRDVMALSDQLFLMKACGLQKLAGAQDLISYGYLPGDIDD